MKQAHETNRILRWSCAVIGGAITLYGLHGLVGALNGITSRQFLQWFVGADLVVRRCGSGSRVTRLAG